MKKKYGRCEACGRRLVLRALTILHDDLGEHELCSRCEEVYSRNTMRYFAREIARYGEAMAFSPARAA